VAEDVSRRQLPRTPRRRDPRDERDRHRALGHSRQGARTACFGAARRPAARQGPRLRLDADAGYPDGGPRTGRGATRAGIHRGQARLCTSRTRRSRSMQTGTSRCRPPRDSASP
jgi:hypothetical protein